MQYKVNTNGGLNALHKILWPGRKRQTKCVGVDPYLRARWNEVVILSSVKPCEKKIMFPFEVFPLIPEMKATLERRFFGPMCMSTHGFLSLEVKNISYILFWRKFKRCMWRGHQCGPLSTYKHSQQEHYFPSEKCTTLLLP